jgi:hypothetical protein
MLLILLCACLLRRCEEDGRLGGGAEDQQRRVEGVGLSTLRAGYGMQGSVPNLFNQVGAFVGGDDQPDVGGV